MSSWLEFRAAVVAAVTAALPAAVRTPAQLNGPTVSWFDDRRPFAKHRLLLSVVTAVPEHDRDSALAEGGEQELSSAQLVTVQVQAESSHDQSNGPTPGGDALWLIEQVRLGLRKVSVRDGLTTAGVVIAAFPGPTVSRSFPADGRVISAHSFDVQFRAVFDFDASGEDAGLIERVEADGADELAGLDFDVDDPTPEP